MYSTVWRSFPINIFIYTTLLIIYLPENAKPSPTYYQIPIQQASQLLTTNDYLTNTWSQYNNPEEGMHHQGDILILNNPKTITTFKEQLWPNGIVYYTVDDIMEKNPQQLGIVKEAMRIIMEKTCIKFQQIYPDEKGQYSFRNWVHIIGNYSGCTSDLGRNPFGGPSVINLNVNTCFNVIGHALHELLHTLGVYHEHIRPDRDQHVDIIWDNIKDGNEYNFKLLGGNMVQDYGLPYDYDSIMHYSVTAFSKDKSLPTIVPKINGKEIGQRNRLSYYDVQKLLIAYECSQTHSWNQLSYADENNDHSTELISTQQSINTSNRPEKISGVPYSTTIESVPTKHYYSSTMPSVSLDKTNDVNPSTKNNLHAEHSSKEQYIEYYSINPNFIFVSFPVHNFYIL